jgi:hypothetical protein
METVCYNNGATGCAQGAAALKGSCTSSLRINAMTLPGAANASSTQPSQSPESGAQGLARLCFPPYGHTWPPQPSDHSPTMPLTALLAVATVACDTAAPHATSRRGRSVPPPWLESWAATAWPSRCRGSVRGRATADVSWHGANRGYSMLDTMRAAGVSPPRVCRVSSHTDRPPRHVGGSSSGPAR